MLSGAAWPNPTGRARTEQGRDRREVGAAARQWLPEAALGIQKRILAIPSLPVTWPACLINHFLSPVPKGIACIGLTGERQKRGGCARLTCAEYELFPASEWSSSSQAPVDCVEVWRSTWVGPDAGWGVWRQRVAWGVVALVHKEGCVSG